MLFCVSASHKTASFDLLERLSTISEPMEPILTADGTAVRGAVVLSTCNRFEAYLDLDVPDSDAREHGLAAARAAIEATTSVTGADLEGATEVTLGSSVAEHLFAVASGLESVVVGEGEIGGQVRRALAEARERGTTTSDLERLFQRATQAQRGVKNSTAIGRAGRSIVRLALQLADSRVADWADMRVLLVGTGSYAAATLSALRDLGVVDIAVHSPSGRGAKFALRHGLTAVDHDRLVDEIGAAAMVITCTSATNPVIHPEMFHDADGETMVIDLGMPRNVHPSVGTAPGVTLLDLETISLHAPLDELQAADSARDLVRDAAAKFDTAGRERDAQAAIVALRSHIFSLTQAEVDRARGRGESEAVEQAMRHLVGVLLHEPTTRARSLAASGRADEVFDALNTLFGIDARAAIPAECPLSTVRPAAG